jgi:hypothetical protein
MGEIADYFRREKYITRRSSMLVLGGSAFLMAIVFASARGRIPAWSVTWAIFFVAAVVGVSVGVILKRAKYKFPISSTLDDLALDKATRRKLRGRILLLESFVVIYAIGLLAGLWHARTGPLLPLFIGITVNLLMEFVLIKAIRRLKRKMDQAMNADFFNRVQSVAQSD